MFYDSYNGEVIRLYGRNTDVGTSWENVNDLSSLITWDASENSKVQISSSSTADTASSGTGAQKITLFGLDGNYEFQSEVISLNGQTQVESSKTWKRLFCAEVSLAGSGLVNAGDIYIIKTGTGGTVTTGVPGTLTSAWIKIPVGYGTATSGIFTAPAGRNYVVEKGYTTVVKQSAYLGIFMFVPTQNTCVNHFTGQITATGGGLLEMVHPIHHVIPEKTDIYIRAQAYNAGGDMTSVIFLHEVRVPRR